MIIRGSLALVVALVACASGATAAHARPDPGERVSGSEVAARGGTDRPRPTGPAEHVSLNGSQANNASVAGARPKPDVAKPPVAVTVAGDGFDWLSAGVGGLMAFAALGLVAGGLQLRRRANRLPTADVKLPQAM